ncbi:MAG: peptide chain release factor 3, partial [Actinobacteria bacterium]|nr:peptide chain release factor 3 [Actinomycetota bacterium]
FSEDTYRVLSGVDAAVMVLDASRGVEPQTLKLFEVCRRRGTPLITFVNKMDRPAPDTLEILDDIEQQIGVRPTPVTWPVRFEGRFQGIVDRRDGSFRRFSETQRGARKGTEDIGTVEDAVAAAPATAEELELMTALEADHDQKTFLAGDTTPVFFGSALQNFGVRLLLDAIVELAPPPAPRLDVDGEPRPLESPVSGFVFKIQANMDPRHRDRIAFVRICSGEFERGMQLTCTRTGRALAAKYVHETLGQERETLDVAYPGDVIGLVNATDLRIGDTLHAGDPVTFPGLPTFTPEHFRVAMPADRSRVKQFRRGLEQLDEEGAVQVLRHADLGDQEPILAAVGVLQFEVASWRLEHEFGAPVRLEPTSRSVARRTDEASVPAFSAMSEVEIYRRSDDTPLVLFRDRFQLERIERQHPDLTLDVIVNG